MAGIGAITLHALSSTAAMNCIAFGYLHHDFPHLNVSGKLKHVHVSRQSSCQSKNWVMGGWLAGFCYSPDVLSRLKCGHFVSLRTLKWASCAISNFHPLHLPSQMEIDDQIDDL